MKHYKEYENEKELLADINLALENVKEYLFKVDSPLSKFKAVVDLQEYLKSTQQTSPFKRVAIEKSNLKVKSNMEQEMVKM